MAIAAEFERGGRELVVLDPHMLIPMPRPHCLADAELLPRIALSMTGGRRASLILANGNGEVWLEAGVGVGLPAGQSLSLGPGIVSRVFETHQPVVVQDLSETSFPAHPERGYETRSCMAVPVLFGTECHGVMCVSDPSRSQVFTADDFESLKLLTDHIGNTIRSTLSLQAQVNLDNLTGVQNRRAFEERLAVEVERVRRFGRSLSILLVDINSLGRINERDGQLVGDQVLQWIARTLVETVRRVDLVGRYGNDEFAVILPETGAGESIAVANRILQSIRGAPADANWHFQFAVRMSVGISTIPPAANSVDLLMQAYTAMNMAKSDRDGLCHWAVGKGETPRCEEILCHCAACGRAFVVRNSSLAKTRRYCSRSCAAVGRRELKQERNLTILGLRADGLTLHDIAQRFGISEERVRQICESL